MSSSETVEVTSTPGLRTHERTTVHVGASATPAEMTWGALAVLTGIALIVAFSESMLIPALPLIEAQYSASSAVVAWVPAIYLLVGAASVPLTGKLGDIYGRKRVLVCVMAIYSFGALGNAFSWSLDSLLVFRALQGVGLAMFPLAFALIHDQMPARRVPVATGLVSGMNSIGSTVGLLGGAVITADFGWQTNYKILAPLAVVVTVLLAWFVVEGRREEKDRIDYAGAAFFAIGVGLLLVAITEGPELGWASAASLSLFLGSAALLATFVVLELRVKAPLMNLRLPRISQMLRTDLLMFLAGAAFYFGFLAVIYFAQGPSPGFGLEIIPAASILLPGAVSMIFFALLAGVLMRRFGIRFPQFIALLLFLLGFGSFLAAHDTPLQIALGFVPIVAGVAMLFNCCVNATMILSPPEKVGAQNGTLAVFQNVGQSVAAGVAGSALAAHYNPITGGPNGEAYVVIAFVGILCAIIGLIVLATMPRIDVPKTTLS